MKMPKYGAGFRRMKNRLGPQRVEEIRQQVLKDQQAALADAGDVRTYHRDRTSYTDYPKPRRKT